jgi:hypothetical protein
MTGRARVTERHALALGLALAAAFVATAVLVAVGTVPRGGSPWAVLHLAMAGAATVAIGTFMPHFAVTLAGTSPAPTHERVSAIVLLALGATGVVAGMTILGPTWTLTGTALLLAGLAMTARHVIAPSRDPLARRHPIALLAYGLALAELATAMVIGAAGAIGLPAVVAAWAMLRPAHAWLALFGAVSLTIFATLVYLGPTVLGARIRPSIPLVLGLVGIAAGPVVAAVGFAMDARPVVGVGMAATGLGAIGQVAYVVDAYRRRGPFSSEHDWRRVAVVHLAAGTAWFAAVAIAAFVAFVGGAPLRGWSIGALAIPMVGGWLLQELVGSWTHLVPAVTPAGPAQHARQRRVLAVASRTRLTAWNVGVGTTWAGVVLGSSAMVAIGGIALGSAVVASLGLLARSLTEARY